MSSSELAATLWASAPIYADATGLRVKVGVDAAQPVLDEEAATRANWLVGVLLGERVKTSVELHLPIAGEPSSVSLVLQLSVGGL